MLEPQVWREAATQVFFALGLGFGGVIAFSSYNKRDNNCHFDAVLVSVINFMTSILATLVVFAVLGFKANVMNEKCVVEYVWPPNMSVYSSHKGIIFVIGLSYTFHCKIISVLNALNLNGEAGFGGHPAASCLCCSLLGMLRRFWATWTQMCWVRISSPLTWTSPTSPPQTMLRCTA